MIAVGPPRVSSRRLVPAEAPVREVKDYGARLGDALLAGDVGRRSARACRPRRGRARACGCDCSLQALRIWSRCRGSTSTTASWAASSPCRTRRPSCGPSTRSDVPAAVRRDRTPARARHDLEPVGHARARRRPRGGSCCGRRPPTSSRADGSSSSCSTDATLSCTAARAARHFHVFHFIGHGGFDETRREGVLVLERTTARHTACRRLAPRHPAARRPRHAAGRAQRLRGSADVADATPSPAWRRRWCARGCQPWSRCRPRSPTGRRSSSATSSTTS